MTYRIDRVVVGEEYVILRISGRITGQDVDMLRALLEQDGRVAAIDLKDILLVDREVGVYAASKLPFAPSCEPGLQI